VEVGGQHFFSSLPGAWGGLGVLANATWIDSRHDSFIVGQQTPLPNLSRKSANLVLMYEQRAVSARLAYNWRDRFLNGFTNIVGLGSIPAYTRGYGWLDASLTWRDVHWLASLTRLPILLKGVQHRDDARHALECGMDGVIVSNHAGRQIDGAIASLDALPGVVAAVDGRAPVLFDSGVRGGADVFRALALGASAVCVGRPWVYGMAIAGEEGAREALRNLIAEFDLVLGLSGHRSIAELTPEVLVPA